MSTNITTIDTDNYAVMAKAMGMATDTGTKQKASTLARLRINHSPLMGQSEINGKNVNVEVVEGGTYKLDIPDGETFYSTTAKVRPFVQRYMYKRFVMGTNDSPNKYIKTVMNDNLNVDLKDNDGGFNCGKPAGFIQDFKALDQSTQDLIKQIKRVRVILGTVELVNPVNASGDSVELGVTPFIWEVENRDAFKILGNCFVKLSKMKRLPPQHNIEVATEQRKLPNGNSFYIPSVSLNLTNVIKLSEEDQQTFADFMQWIDNYNDYIINAWNENSRKKEDMDMDIVQDLVETEEIPFE
jgi:hypothetical protein|tara:strand:+ start:101 stop:994 length:894 start_codon:yes stop_codon:yes gene_type:complete